MGEREEKSSGKKGFSKIIYYPDMKKNLLEIVTSEYQSTKTILDAFNHQDNLMTVQLRFPVHWKTVKQALDYLEKEGLVKHMLVGKTIIWTK